MSDEKITINVNILDRVYPLTIPRKDEEVLRSAAKRINDYCQKLSTQNGLAADKEFLLAMVSLQFAMRFIETEKRLQEGDMCDAVNSVCEELDDFIKINQ